MAPVQLYVHETNDFLLNCEKEGLVVLLRQKNNGIQIERLCSCACNSPHDIVVDGNSVIIVRDKHIVSGFPSYALPLNCTDKEIVTIVAWLTRHNFYVFQSVMQNNCLKRGIVSSEKTFLKTAHDTCSRCERYTLDRDPVFCLKRIVISAQKKGPTVDCVL
jgi:hypothetical protein